VEIGEEEKLENEEIRTERYPLHKRKGDIENKRRGEIKPHVVKRYRGDKKRLRTGCE
jgi:hypothetical protein